MLAVGLAGCALPVAELRPGMTQDEVLRTMGPPTGRYPMPQGTRLEYASGPYGRTTWMVDLDQDGRALRWQQVLSERHRPALQGRLPGMTREQLLRTLGRPGEVRPGGWQGGQVWSWRYETYWCLWFQSSIGDDGIVRDGVFGPEPMCERDDDRGSSNE